MEIRNSMTQEENIQREYSNLDCYECYKRIGYMLVSEELEYQFYDVEYGKDILCPKCMKKKLQSKKKQ